MMKTTQATEKHLRTPKSESKLETLKESELNLGGGLLTAQLELS